MSCNYHNGIPCNNTPAALNNLNNDVNQNIANFAICAANHINCTAYNNIQNAGVCWDAVRICRYLGSGNAAIATPDNILKTADNNDIIINQGNMNTIAVGAIVKFFRLAQNINNVAIGTIASHVMLSLGNGQFAGSNNGALGNMNGGWSIHNMNGFAWNGNEMLVRDNEQILRYSIRVDR